MSNRSFLTEQQITAHLRSSLYRTNYTNFTIGEKFLNFMELCNVMELYVGENELFILCYKPTVPPRQQFLVAVYTLLCSTDSSNSTTSELNSIYRTDSMYNIQHSVVKAR